MFRSDAKKGLLKARLWKCCFIDCSVLAVVNRKQMLNHNKRTAGYRLGNVSNITSRNNSASTQPSIEIQLEHLKARKMEVERKFTKY